jgi:mannosyltransferase
MLMSLLGAGGQRRSVALIAGILLIAVCLRGYSLRYKRVWLDEAYSIELARHSVGEIIQGCRLDVHPPLYYIALHLWMGVFGRSEPAVGALSATFDLAGLALILLWGRRISGERPALLLGLLLSISPAFVEFSSLVRMYTLLNLLVLASFFSLIAYLREPRRLNLTAWWGATLLGLHTHYSFFALLGIQVIYVFAYYRKERELLRRWRLALLSIIVLMIPWSVVMAEQLSWAAARAVTAGRSLADALSAALNVAASGIAALFGMSGRPIAAVLLLLVPLGLRSTRAIQMSRREKTLVLLWVLSSMAFYAVAGRFIRPYAALHLSVALFVLIVPVLPVQTGLARCRFLIAALIVAVVGLNLALLAYQLSALPEEYRQWRWKEIGEVIEQRGRPGDCIIVNACFMSLPLRYYYRGALPIHGVLEDFDVLRTRQVEEGKSPDRPLTPENVRKRLGEILPGCRRVWLVEAAQDFTDPKGYIRGALFRQMRLIADWHWEGRFELYLLDKNRDN